MNKYENALMTLFCKAHTNDEVCEANKCTKDESCLECNIQKAFEKLQELVEKATPKKPIVEADGYDKYGELVYDEYYCPACGERVDDTDHHCECGQALDFGEEE